MSPVIKNHPVFSGREEEAKKFFLCLLLLNCVQLKIILMSNCHILGVAYSDLLHNSGEVEHSSNSCFTLVPT